MPPRRPSLLRNIRLQKIANQIQSEFTREDTSNFQADIRRGLGRQSTQLGGNITALGDEPEVEMGGLPISIDDAGLPTVNPDFDLTSISVDPLNQQRLPATSFFRSILRGGRQQRRQEIERRAESVDAFQKRLSATSLGRRSTTNRRANLLRSNFNDEDLRLGVL